MAANEPTTSHLAIKVDGADLPITTLEMLLEAHIETSLYLPGMFTMMFHDSELELLEGSVFELGKAVIFETPDANDVMVKIFEGEITAIEPSFERGRATTLSIRGYDKTHRLNRGTKTMAHVNVTDSDIVRTIAGEAGLSAQVETTSPVREHVFQDGFSDLEFLHALARRNGFEVWVEESTLHFDKPGRSRGTAIDLEYGADLIGFNPRLSIAKQAAKVQVRGWDPAQKQAIVAEATRSTTTPGAAPQGVDATASAIAFPADKIEVRLPVVSNEEATTLAQSILDDINANYLEAEGTAIGNPGIQAGAAVNLTGLGSKFDGEYVVTTAVHVFEVREPYKTEFEIEGPRARQMADLVSDNRAISHLSSPNGWGGVVPAIVTNIDDPDGQGRVKVKYPWLDDETDGYWARLVGAGGGPETGIFWLPEIDDEVLIAFDRGDINFPYVIGGLWNGQDAIPEAAPVDAGAVVVRTMMTRAGHIIRLTDTSGSEKIEIIDSATNTSVIMDQAEEAITVESTKDITLKAGGKIVLDATGDIELKGANVKADAQTNLEMTAGATGKIESSAPLTLKGATVNIN